MNDDIDNDLNTVEDSHIDADTDLTNINFLRLNDLNDSIKDNDIKYNDPNNPSLFPANNLVRKTADNLAQAEAMVDEKPLRTEKTAELERKEAELDRKENNRNNL